jgi:transposase-like protein
VLWQRCQYHLQQNAQKYVPREELKPQVAADIRSIFDAPDGKEAERLLKKTMATYEKSAPTLSQWMAASLHEGPTVSLYRRRTRTCTTNAIERVNREGLKVRRAHPHLLLSPNDTSYGVICYA